MFAFSLTPEVLSAKFSITDGADEIEAPGPHNRIVYSGNPDAREVAIHSGKTIPLFFRGLDWE